MATYRDIDTAVRINNGDLTIPSNNLIVTVGSVTAASIIEGGVALSSKYVPQARGFLAGNGLTGGGDLTTTRTLSVNFSGNGSGTGVSYANHNHDVTYLALTGGTLTDNLTISGTAYGQITLKRNAPFNVVAQYMDVSNNTLYAGLATANIFGIGSAIDLNASASGVFRFNTTTGTITTAINKTVWDNGNLVSPVQTTRLINTSVGLLGGGDLTADRTLSVNFSGNGSGTGVAYANHNHDSVYPKMASSDNSIISKDTRAVNDLPQDRNLGLYVDFKANSSNALSDGGTYNGTLTFRKYGSGTDMSGGYPMQLAYTDNGNLWMRIGTSTTTWGTWSKFYHSTSLDITKYVKNDTAGQTVLGNFTINGDGNLWVGTTANDGQDGDLVVRNGVGLNVIHLDGDASGAVDANVKAYIGGNGSAIFNGTVAINTLQVTSSGNIANLSATYVNGIAEPKLAKNESVFELGGKGVYTGLAPSQKTVPNMSVDIATGTMYTDTGRRVVISATNVALSAASATYGRYDIIYVQGSSGGNNEGVLAVAGGTPASSPVDPTIPTDAVKIARIFVGANVGSILTANITDSRLWRPVNYAVSSGLTLNTPLYLNMTQGAKIDGDGPILVNKPLKAVGWATTLSIPSGSTSVTWTHNLGNSGYVVTYSTDNPNRHIYWSGKSGNTIMFNLDDATNVPINIDVILVDI